VETWFSLPKNNSAEYIDPPYYKKVILGVLAVYPLILLQRITIKRATDRKVKTITGLRPATLFVADLKSKCCKQFFIESFPAKS